MENLMESTPDTSIYMIAGFVVSFVTIGVYVLSLYIRNLNLKRDIETLKSLDEKPAKK
jgi:hypothetical protein